MRLHKVEGRNSYCGPAAIAAITGKTTDEAAATVRRNTGRRHVKGMYDSELKQALQDFGYRAMLSVRYTKSTGRPTLARWLREREDRTALYVIVVAQHYVVVKGNKFVDSFTREPVWISKAPGRRRRVHKVYMVNKLPKAEKVEVRKSISIPELDAFFL